MRKRESKQKGFDKIKLIKKGRDEREHDNTKGERTSLNGTGPNEKIQERLDAIKLTETRRKETRYDGTAAQDGAGRDVTRQEFQDHGILE